MRSPNLYIYLCVGGHKKHGRRHALQQTKRHFIALLASFAPIQVAGWHNKVYPLPGKLET